MTQTKAASLLSGLSSELAGVVEGVAPSVVRVDDGSRLTATGVVWAADGVILTTSHGVERDEDLTVELADGTRLAATLAGRDPESDLAVLRVPEAGLPAVQTAGAEAVKVGHLVLALGRPGDEGLQATLGIVSARLEAQNNGQPEYILHTDANLYPGFSGGPLVDIGGRMVGLTNLMFGRGRGVALGTPIVAHVANLLLTQGRVTRGYLGVRTQRVLLPEKLRADLGLAQAQGLLLVGLEDDSPAEKGGLLLGDILLGLSGRAIEDGDELRRRLRTLEAGESVALRLLRAGTVHDLPVVLGADEPQGARE